MEKIGYLVWELIKLALFESDQKTFSLSASKYESSD